MLSPKPSGFAYRVSAQVTTNRRWKIDNDGLPHQHFLQRQHLLGLLNSRLFWFAISNISIPFGIRAGSYRYRLIYQYMEKVPIRVINFSDRDDKVRHDKMVKLVEQMLALHKQMNVVKTRHDKVVLQRQIDATDRRNDQLVYELYDLTDDEIRIVENAAAKV